MAVNPPIFTASKPVIIILVIINILIYAVDDIPSALDDTAWLGLLLLIDTETRHEMSKLHRKVLHGVRYCLAALILAGFINSIGTEAWLDVINTSLWFSIIILMEIEVRCPERARTLSLFVLTGYLGLLLGLVIVAGLWLWQGSWLDAYDACLWIAAFAIIEQDIADFLRRENSVSLLMETPSE